MTLEDIYLKCPSIIQSLLINLQGYRIHKVRYNKNFNVCLNRFLNSDPHETDIRQLSAFILEAQKTPFWNDRFRKFNVNILETADLKKELQKLPLITKAEVKDSLESIINLNTKEKISYNHTSGTTGNGLVFPQTLSMENKQWAIWWRYRSWHGITANTWMGWFGGRSIVSANQLKTTCWHINYPMKQVMFSAHRLNEKTVSDYFNQIKKRRLSWLHGYPSQLSLLAQLIKKQRLGSLPDVKIITLGAENVLLPQKAIIEEVFEAPVKQHYGMAEGVANISEQTDGSLVPDQDFCWVEFVPADPANPQLCKIIGTNYNNTAFPLIRYDTGDLAEVEWQSDGSPKILSIDGRQEDYITLPDGVKLGRLDHIFKDLTEIQEAQIYQPDLKSIIIRVVKGNKYDEIRQEQRLRLEAEKRLGKDIHISVDYIDKIPRTKSGKLRFVISEVK
jgi:phenylacetate-CoA ligase